MGDEDIKTKRMGSTFYSKANSKATFLNCMRTYVRAARSRREPSLQSQSFSKCTVDPAPLRAMTHLLPESERHFFSLKISQYVYLSVVLLLCIVIRLKLRG